MLKIGTFSKLSRISIRMLRHYDEIGLLRPAVTDPFTNYRYYAEEQLGAAARVCALREMGFSLAEIGLLMKSGGDEDLRRRLFDARRAALMELERETARRLRLLDAAEAWPGKESMTMDYSINIKTIPERTVASLRMILPNYASEGMGWDILCRETGALNLVPDDPCLCCAVYHDGEFKEADVDVELQKSVRGSYPDTEHVRFRTEPAVRVASLIHNGAYDGLDDAVRALAQWISAGGYDYAGPSFFIYHVSPHETDKPEEFVTEICFPVA